MSQKILEILCIAAAACCVVTAQAQERDAEAEALAGIEAWQRGDMIGALSHYHKAAEAGSALAQAKLGYIYDQSEDNEKAVRWYREAASQQHPEGEFGLGEMYAKGESVEQDLDTAVEFYMRAAVGGHAQARRVLANAYETGALGRQIDNAEALRWLTLAANSGDINAMRRMATLYSDGGLDVVPDPATAEQWQRRADTALLQ